MKFKKLLLSVIALSISSLTFAQSVPDLDSEEVVLNFSSVTAPDSPKGLAAEYFAKKAAELSKGKVKIKVYHNSKLFKDKDELNALLDNKVQILAPSLSKFGSIGVPEYEIFSLPFLFDSPEQLYKITDGKIGKELFKKLEAKGFLGLSYWDNGFKSFSSNSPIKKPIDLKGKIMRIQFSKVIEDQMKSAFARPVQMDFAEMYPALQTGVVDGAENPHSNFYGQKLYEVQKYVTVSEHGYLGYAVIVNNKYWKELPKDIRDAVDAALKEATIYERKISSEENQKALDSIKANGKIKVYTLNQSEKEEFKKTFAPAYKNLEAKIGKPFMDSVLKEVGKQ